MNEVSVKIANPGHSTLHGWSILSLNKTYLDHYDLD